MPYSGKTEKKAIVLLSGGLDSTTLMAVAQKEGFMLFALTFDYGQRHGTEIQAAQKVAQFFQAEKHLIFPVNLRLIGGSALTTDSINVPKDRPIDKVIPVTYVPARNTVFLSLALAWAEMLGAEDIFIGVNAVDYSGYPDCRSEFIEAFSHMANLATRAGVTGKSRIKIHTPLVKKTKAEIIRLGLELGVDYAMTHSCYDPKADGTSCSACDSCVLRQKGFREAGVPDPLAEKE
jgi:7-cyano-7-deazaguanine synthase